MADKPPTKATSTSHEISPPTSTHHHPTPPPSQRLGESIMKSTDPSTAALREWAKEKEFQRPGANGSIAVNSFSVDAMGWSGAHLIPREGDTLLPPDEKHGEAEYVGPVEGEHEHEHESGSRKSRLSGLFRRKEKGDKEGRGEEGDVVK